VSYILLGGIKDYTYQNIIFVHDFVYIFLILVFLIIMGYFIIIFIDYVKDSYKAYFKMLIRQINAPINIISRHYWLEPVLSKDYNKNYSKDEVKKTFWIRKKKKSTSMVFKRYALYINDILNTVHNLKLEVIWTFIPIFIVLELIFPSLSLIADDEIGNKASLHTVSVIGNQWYWTYELNTVMGILKQVSNLVLIDETEPSNKKYARLLTTTNAISIPVGLKTSFFITSNDVAHSWAIQGLGIKVDAIPGRINLKTVIVSKIGLYTGMCSELCGIEHGFMPISLQVLTLNNWGYNLENMNEKILTYIDVKNIWQI
jgi:heme/copper-type cytochrome/quinol oxidase subunit 2